MDALATYTVMYRGGLPGLPKAKVGGIMFRVFSDRFEFTPKAASKKFWSELVVPYSRVHDLSIAGRHVNTFEAIAGGLDSRQLNQMNNIHIKFTSDSGQVLTLRLEMLTGVFVPAQAKRCAELQDMLTVSSIRTQFTGA